MGTVAVLATMYAVKHNVDMKPIFVREGELGYWDCAPEDMEVWASMFNAQPEGVTRHALSASMFGWERFKSLTTHGHD